MTPSKSPGCHVPSDSEVDELLRRWTTSLRSGDPAQVAWNYADGAVLLPTFMDRVLIAHDDKVEYFKQLIAQDATCTIVSRSIFASCNSATAAGIYIFELGDGTTVEARFTFTFSRDYGEWRICAHHSSVQPVLP